MPICPSVEAALAAERCDRQPRPCSTSVIADAGSEALLRQVLEALDDGIIVADDSGAIALANRRLEEMFGYPLGTVTGKPVTSLIPADLHVRHAGQRTERPRNPKPGLPGTTPPVVAVRQDGGDFPVRISLSQVAAGTGQVRLGDGELGEAGEGAPAAPGPRCWTLTGRIVRSASLLEKMSGQGGWRSAGSCPRRNGTGGRGGARPGRWRRRYRLAARADAAGAR
jgi:PAS domain S-box-containing protein